MKTHLFQSSIKNSSLKSHAVNTEMRMVVFRSTLLSPNLIPLSSVRTAKRFANPPSPLQLRHHTYPNSCDSICRVALVSSPKPEPVDVDSLRNDFGGKGVTFSSIGDSCVVTMTLENRSVSKLMLPSGLITSYKPLMWHQGTVELLHTTVSNGNDGEALVQGGVSLAFASLDFHGNSTSWPAPNSWVLQQVARNPKESIQVKLISKDTLGNVEVEHVITLREDHLSSEVIIRNSSASSLCFAGLIISHLTVSTPEATYACGLQGSDFYRCPPVLTDFSLIHPSLDKVSQSSTTKWGPMKLPELFNSRNPRNQEYALAEGTMSERIGMQAAEEEDDQKNLAEEMSRIYTSAPQHLTLMDRGRRNSLIVSRNGFSELYMFSPGSSHQWYGKYAYICIGQAALLHPITLAPNKEWRGEQHLFNPNL